MTLLGAALLSASVTLPAAAAEDRATDLEVEVIRPGIERVLEPAVGRSIERVQHVAAAPEGRVWAATADGTVFAVGEPESFGPETHGLGSGVQGLAILDDGTVVLHDGRRIASWDGSRWTQHEALGDETRGSVRAIASGDGGVHWALLETQAGPSGDQLAKLGPDGVEYFTLGDLDLGFDDPAWATSLARTPDGTIWLGLAGVDGPPAAGLLRFDGESWSPTDPLGDSEPYSVWELDVAADGTLYAFVVGEGRRDSALARWDGATWTLDPTPERSATGTPIPGRSEWPADDWLRWAPSAGPIDYAFPGPFTAVRVTDTAPGSDGSLWVVLMSDGKAPVPGGPAAGLYRIDPDGAAASLPEYRTAGRHGLVPLRHPKFATNGGGDGNGRAEWTQRQGTDVVAEVFAIGTRWYAGLDSVGRAGDRWIRKNSVGTGSTPKAAIKDALRKEKRVTFVNKAVRSAQLEWPSPSPDQDD